MKHPLSFCKLVMAAAVALPTMALATITPEAPQQDTDNCYMIGSVAELYGFAEMVNGTDGGFSGCGKLTANIVVNENVLGTDNANVNASGAYTGDDSNFDKWAPINGFAGKFHGQGLTISGLYFNNPEKENVGLFGNAGDVEIDGLGLVDSYFGGSSKVGGFVGYAGGTVYIRNSYNSSVVRGLSAVNDWWCGVGGFVGAAEVNKLEIENSYNLGFVTGGPAVGGLVGIIKVNENFSVSNSYNAGDVKGTAEAVGGLVGYVGYLFSEDVDAGIVSSYNTGSVVCGGVEGVGGLVGYLDYGFEIRIVNSYNTGTVDGNYAGGLVGGDDGGGWAGYANVYNSYNAGFVNGGDGDALGFYDEVDNFYYLEGSSGGFYTSKSAEEFADGTVAEALHDWCEKDGDVCKEGGLDGSVWGQVPGRDAFPTLAGAIGPVLTLHVYGEVKVDSTYTPGTALPTPTREGFAFLGWFTDAGFSGSAVTNIPSDATGALEYFAKWIGQDVYGCYEIASAAELYSFAAIVNGGAGEICGKLTDDITVNEGLLGYVEDGVFNLEGYMAKYGKEPKAWTPMNVWNSKMQVTLDGNGKKISGLYIDGESSMDNVGLFSNVGAKVAIRNLGIVDSYIVSKQNAGAFAGYVTGSGLLDITNCYNASTIVVTYTAAGGLVGCSGTGTVNISQSYNAGAVINTGTATTAGDWPGYIAGGFVGSTESGALNIVNSYNLGSVTASQWNVGGFVGYAGDGLSLTIANSYNMGILKNSESNTTNIVGYFATTSTMFAANNFFVGRGNDGGAMGMSAEKFKDGSVATYLHNYETTDVDGSVWGQAEDDDYPVFSKEVKKDVKTSDLVLHLYAGYVLAPSFYVEGSEYDLPANLVREGYVFLGWYKTSYFSGSVVTKIPANATGKLEYYAKWMKFSDNCYEIASAEDLYDFAAIVNGGAGEICGKLMDNISVNENVLTSDGVLNVDLEDDFAPWTPIGTSGAQFKGTFNGQGHTISGLYFKDDDANDVGLFGYVGKASIQNVGVVDSYFKGWQHVGGVVGEMSGSITNCYNKGVVSGTKYVGGVLGMLNEGSISNVYNVGSVSGNEFVGGVVGNVESENTVSNVYNIGSVSGSERVGGVAGACADEVSVNNAFYNKDAFTEDAIGESCEGNFDNVEGRTASEFADGTVALLLHNYVQTDCEENCVDGSIWGQDLSKENSLPEFIERLDYRLGSVTFFEKAGKIDSAHVDATSDLVVDFPEDVVVSGPIKFKRSFAGSGYSTIVLPFTPKFETDADTIAGVNFYEFSYYDNATNSVHTKPVSQKSLTSKMPYLVQSAGVNELVFKKGGTFNTMGGAYSVRLTGTGAGWTIYGTYAYKTWKEGDAGLGSTYGFAGVAGNKEEDVGQFKKIGVGAYIYPMRAYLEYVAPAPAGRPAANGAVRAFAANTVASLPETINVVIVEKGNVGTEVAGSDDASGEQTTRVIGTVNTRTGEFKFANDRWFDLNGRYLGNKKPTQKGAYYNNGKKVIVK